ncbi:unnamed protein product [Lactuca saligna]|uniref:Uncharacterized protein n=1 Tax=Lactuca saligna TaxID=75948 RepID=A0AA36E8N3_LACSI|nr:unnamed protein product [Lactuca saligna]
MGGDKTCSCSNNNVVETSGLASDGEREKSIKYTEELMERGSTVNKEKGYAEVGNCFSSSLEIRCALLYKAQEEFDQLVSVEDEDEDEEGSDGEDEEDKSGLDLAWTLLDVSRAIWEKEPDYTVEKINILSVLAEVALEGDKYPRNVFWTDGKAGNAYAKFRDVFDVTYKTNKFKMSFFPFVGVNYQ